MSVTFDKTGISVDIKTDDKDVISTGFVHAYGDTLDFEVSTLKFKLVFIDKKEEPSKVSGRIENGILILEVTNYNNSMGAGTVEPLEVGFYDNKKLYISFVISRNGSARLRRVEYTFYLGEPTQ